MFNLFKKKEDPPSPPTPIDFEKKHEGRIDLVKKTLTGINLMKTDGSLETEAQVIFCIDRSGSMENHYRNGDIQYALDRLLPVAEVFDDDGKLDVFLFHDRAYHHLTPFAKDNREDYVKRELGQYSWGGTNYAPALRAIDGMYNNAGKRCPPAYVLFLTDGANADERDTENTLKLVCKHGIFWQFVGMNKNKNEFRFLQRLDKMKGRFIDNANFFDISDLHSISDADLYRLMFAEFPAWIQAARNQKIID